MLKLRIVGEVLEEVGFFGEISTSLRPLALAEFFPLLQLYVGSEFNCPACGYISGSYRFQSWTPSESYKGVLWVCGRCNGGILSLHGDPKFRNWTGTNLAPEVIRSFCKPLSESVGKVKFQVTTHQGCLGIGTDQHTLDLHQGFGGVWNRFWPGRICVPGLIWKTLGRTDQTRITTAEAEWKIRRVIHPDGMIGVVVGSKMRRAFLLNAPTPGDVYFRLRSLLSPFPEDREEFFRLSESLFKMILHGDSGMSAPTEWKERLIGDIENSGWGEIPKDLVSLEREIFKIRALLKRRV